MQFLRVQTNNYLQMRIICLSILIFFFVFNGFSQKARITGVVLDLNTGNPLPGATINLEPANRRTTSDLNGKYSFSNLTEGSYTITSNFISYAQKNEAGVQVKNNEVVNHDILLSAAYNDLDKVEVKAKRFNRESANTLLVLQKNRPAISDGISAEVIRRTPDKNASDVLKRVSGASLQNDKFAVIRGLNDRYNNGLLNGSPLPSSESDRKAFAFDIFPANLLDNIVIAKTATPDLPGEFAGGIIMVNTKSIPDKNFMSVTIGGGFNSLATFKNKTGYVGGRSNYIDDQDYTGQLPAKSQFPGDFSEQEALAKNFKNNWRLTSGKFSPNYSAQFALGRNFQRKGKDFAGLLVSATYSKTNKLFDIGRKIFENSSVNSADPSIKTADFTNTIYSSQILAGVLANLSLKLNSNNIFNFKNIYNYYSDDRLISTKGERDINRVDNSSVVMLQNARVFNGNQFYSSQLSGEHYIPKATLRVLWSGFYSDIKRKNPSRNDTYIFDSYNNKFVAQIGDGANDNDAGTMKTINNGEKIRGAQLDLIKNFRLGKKIINEFKAGALYQMRERDFVSRRLGFAPGRNFNYGLANLSIDSLFDPVNMGPDGFRLVDKTAPFDTYDGSAKTTAFYGMFDHRFSKLVRFIYGLRFENFDMNLNSVKNDYVTPLNYTNKVNSVLPSANLIISLSEKQNVRLCYSQTVNRPEFREVAPFLFYDYSTGFTVSGNDTLKASKIYNYDIRYEIYPGRGQVLSITGFYKKFKTPIETVYQLNAVNPNISYQNSPDATNVGFETEIRIIPGAILNKESKILNNVTLLANYAYINSKVTIPYSADVKIDRRLQGQSPYVFNAGFIYNDQKNTFGFSAFVNKTGPRVFYGGNNYFADVWENGRAVLDCQFSKSLFKQKMELSLNIKDLLAEKQYFFEDKKNNKKFDAAIDNQVQTTTFGKLVTLNIGIRL